MAESDTSLPSRLIPLKSAESVNERLSDGVLRSTVLRPFSVATLVNDRLDFFDDGSFGSPDLRDVLGGFMALRFGGEV